MALQNTLMCRPDTPYYRPPPLHITVIATKDIEKVVGWIFEEGGRVRPSTVKKNKLAIISDGVSVNKFTMFEADSSKVQEERGYVMRGYGLRGQAPSYSILITKDTQFFRSSPIHTSESLRAEGRKLLSPTSVNTDIRDAVQGHGFMTIQGEVVEVS